MSKRELTPTEVEMGDVLRNGYMAPEVKFERLLAIVEALVNENLAPAMSLARAEALEEPRRVIEILVSAVSGLKAGQPCHWLDAEWPRINAARAGTPAPATHSEKAREVVRYIERQNEQTEYQKANRAMLNACHFDGRAEGAREALRFLGVDLTVKDKGQQDTNHTCAGCCHRTHAPYCCLGDRGECDCGWVP